MIIKPDYIYALGSLPWSEEVLRQAYFGSFTAAEKAIREHPGFPAHRDLLALQLALDIFLDSVLELFSSITAFRADAESPDFWNRPARGRFNSRELAIRRGVFASATSALALVDHSRRVKLAVSVPQEEYEGKLREIFDEEEHRFVQSLRVCVCHIRMLEADWRTTYSASGKETRFLLRREVLLECDKWDAKAKAFIDGNRNGIDVERLFTTYRSRVLRFHDWFQRAVSKASEPELSEYREYERTLKRFGVRASWNLILEQVLKGRDPFAYLDRYLTKGELDEVMGLPRKSQVQVDRIIEILDGYHACDDELRKKVYSAFDIDIPKRET